jgi:XTP/dITP diphosphohydrolase
MAEILVATRNAGKLREIREIAADLPITWRALDEFPGLPDAEETGATFAENARLKALHYERLIGLPTLADDSGLEVDALDGEPGVHSARYAGEPKDDGANNRKLIANLHALERERAVQAATAPSTPLVLRTARFHCAMAFAEHGRVVLESDGRFEGEIADTPRGTNGFGYDPHFLVPDLGLTAAELPSAEKHARSHRGQALRAMLALLQRHLRTA